MLYQSFYHHGGQADSRCLLPDEEVEWWCLVHFWDKANKVHRSFYFQLWMIGKADVDVMEISQLSGMKIQRCHEPKIVKQSNLCM